MKKNNKKTITMKILLCSLYFIIMTILFVAAYTVFKDKNSIKSFSEVDSTNNYSYINISRMSEKFAFYEKANIGIHFVIEKEDTGKWHMYLIAINENSLYKYKNIIDYTYKAKGEEPKPIKVYGYPRVITDQLKGMAIKHINEFLPEGNEVTITNENFEEYLSNCYLDTTISQKNNFSIVLFIILLLIFVMTCLTVYTISDNNRITNRISKYIKKKRKK